MKIKSFTENFEQLKKEIKPVKKETAVQPQVVKNEMSLRAESAQIGSLRKTQLFVNFGGRVPARFPADDRNSPPVAELPKTFTTAEGVPANEDGYFTTPGTEVPEVTGQYIHDETNPIIAKDQYLQALERHKNDPEWLSAFYKTLGTDKTAQLINDAAGSLPPPTVEQRQLIGQSLQSLVAGGYANQADIDALVTATLRGSDGLGGIHRGNLMFLSEAIGGLPNDAAGIQLKNMFSSTIARAASGQLPTDVNNDTDPESARNMLSAVAAHVISTTSASNQTSQMAAFQTTLGSQEFDNFVTRAMRFDSVTWDPVSRDHFTNYDGIGTILKNIGADTSAPSSLTVQLFDVASRNLVDANGEIAEKYRDDLNFKEGIGNLFINNQDEIVNSYLTPNGRGLSSDGLQRLDAFFRETLFTPPLAGNAQLVTATFTNRANAVLADADQLSDEAFMEKYQRNKHDMASLVGQQWGVMVSSMEDALQIIKDKSDEEGSQILGVINAVINSAQIIAGLGGPEAVAASAIIGEPLKLALGGVGEDIANGRYQEALDELKNGGVDVENFDDFSVNDILGSIQNQEVYTSFRDAFDYVKEVLE